MLIYGITTARQLVINSIEQTDEYYKWSKEMNQLFFRSFKRRKRKMKQRREVLNKRVWNTIIMALNNEIQKIERAIDKVKAVNNELLNKKKKL